MSLTKSFKAPFTSLVIDQRGLLSFVWTQFFSLISSALAYLGEEMYFDLVNNQSSAVNIDRMFFDKGLVSAGFVEYLIQRVTSTTNRIQLGILRVTYNPDTDLWSLAEYGTSGPDSAGITFSITSTGQIQYVSSNLGGTQEISRIVFRMRTIQAKSSTYSRLS